MIIGFYIVGNRGQLILNNSYQPELTKTVIDLFKINILNNRLNSVQYPVNKLEKYHFVHSTVADGIYIVCVIEALSNVASVFEFIKAIKNIILSLCSNVTLASLKSKLPILVEMMDETLCYGIPQVTDFLVLKNWVVQADFKKSKKNVPVDIITNQITGQISWRKPGIKHSKHEVYVSITEKINFVATSNGDAVVESADGSIVMKNNLSGMPECKCGLNDKIHQGVKPITLRRYPEQITVDDFSFHQCVRLTNYESDKEINFIPPDGKFELMKYRTTNDILVPFKLACRHKNGETENFMEIFVVLKSLFAENLSAMNIQINIPILSHAAKVTFRCSKGQAKFEKGNCEAIWSYMLFKNRIPRLSGGKELFLCASVDLFVQDSFRHKRDGNPPVTLKFQAPFSCSGVALRYFKIMEPKLNYTDKDCVIYLRYISSEGKYEFRI